MKILFVHSGSDLYGASRSLLRLSSRLAKDGHSVTAILPYSGPLVDELNIKGIKVLIHKGLPIITREKFNISGLISLIIYLPFSVINIVKVIRKNNIDIVHTNTALILSPGIASLLSGVPNIWHVRETFQEFSNFFQFFQWFIYLFSFAIICVSTPIAYQFNRRIQKKISIINNGFPKDEFLPVDIARIENIKKNFNITDELLIGVVGRIKLGRKGQEIFLEAASILQRKYPNAKFFLIGSPFPGNEYHLSRLKELSKSLGLENKIIYTGDISDIKAAISALDILVLPSVLPEPFGGVVIEAMAFKKPVVGTRIGGTIEQIDDGVTGYLVEPNNPVDLAKALDRVLSDIELRFKMGESGRNRYLKLFEFEPFYKKILSLYLSFLKK